MDSVIARATSPADVLWRYASSRMSHRVGGRREASSARPSRQIADHPDHRIRGGPISALSVNQEYSSTGDQLASHFVMGGAAPPVNHAAAMTRSGPVDSSQHLDAT
jgi:hypothetical protein